MRVESWPLTKYRTTEGLGVWGDKGKVAVVGIGHSPAVRRWDGTAATTVGAWSILAMRNAIADAGISPDQVDGMVWSEQTAGTFWPAERPIPEDVVNAFDPTDDPLAGITKLSGEWFVKNMPELTTLNTVIKADTGAPGGNGGCMSRNIVVAAQAISEGLAHTIVVMKAWHNLDGRYYHGGPNAEPTVSGPAKWMSSWTGPTSYGTAVQFQRYMHRYGKTHDMMAPFMFNSRENGLKFPEGYWAQHRPEHLTYEDYVNARWIAKPANLYDNDLPIQNACAYVLTTADRAKDMAQKPVYILGHASDRTRSRSVSPTLEEVEAQTSKNARILYESAGISAVDVDFENMYDGFSLFHVFHLEGLGFAGIGRGEALDFFESEDISIHGPNPISPSGGNVGSGRTRTWMHTDCIQQLQGRAGERQIAKPISIGVSGGPMPIGLGDFVIWGSEPD